MTGRIDVGEIEKGVTSLRDKGVDVVRLLYADLLGLPRSKDVPIDALPRLAESGLAFCAGVFLTALNAEVIEGPGGPAQGLPDIITSPLFETARPLPWEPGVAWVLVDTFEPTGERTAVGPRNVLKRVVDRYTDLGLVPVVGPELEFYLCRRDESGRWTRALDGSGRVYMNGPLVDPDGWLLRMTRELTALDLGVFASNAEFSPSQYEINIWHSEALGAADRAFMLKTAVKERASRSGLTATFMGKPWNDEGGSGFHVHFSVTDADGTTLMADPGAADGLSGTARHMVAGLMLHATALTALGNPTINAFKRLQPNSLAPSRVSWGLDNRTALIRIPPERGSGTRVELRVGDGAANPYLAIAGALAAAYDGIERKLEPPEPKVGWIYELPPEQQGPPLPGDLSHALEALDADSRLRELLGNEVVDLFLTIKRDECERYSRWVSDWEIAEYIEHL